MANGWLRYHERLEIFVTSGIDALARLGEDLEGGIAEGVILLPTKTHFRYKSQIYYYRQKCRKEQIVIGEVYCYPEAMGRGIALACRERFPSLYNDSHDLFNAPERFKVVTVNCVGLFHNGVWQ
ncbi:hypothetical protein SPFM12_00087 [Salmonella phage SPFM12]|nr:hypothetical protein SPFM12_00087 [Salmonella phage SPFM12]